MYSNGRFYFVISLHLSLRYTRFAVVVLMSIYSITYSYNLFYIVFLFSEESASQLTSLLLSNASIKIK